MAVIKRGFSFLSARLTYIKKMAAFFGVTPEEVEALYGQIARSDFIEDIVGRAELGRGLFDLNMSMVLRAPTLYVACRLLKPEVIVETGVANGFSSAFLLQALEHNGAGKLYSIDLPNQSGQELGRDKTTGWIIPDNLRPRWDLILGSSRDMLPGLLRKLEKIDVFYHDSDHSYENMTFEFGMALPFVRAGGLILSDDITDNESFNDFCAKEKLANITLFKTGIAKRSV